jgi:hypothetical protein
MKGQTTIQEILLIQDDRPHQIPAMYAALPETAIDAHPSAWNRD